MNRATGLTLFGSAMVLGVIAWQSIACWQTADPYQFVTLDCIFTTNVVATLEKGKFETATGNKEFA